MNFLVTSSLMRFDLDHLKSVSLYSLPIKRHQRSKETVLEASPELAATLVGLWGKDLACQLPSMIPQTSAMQAWGVHALPPSSGHTGSAGDLNSVPEILNSISATATSNPRVFHLCTVSPALKFFS